MNRHGPRLRTLRRLGGVLPGLTRKISDRRPQPPGAHGTAPARRKRSPYRIRLEEKQKIRANYGVSERQLRRAFAAARAMPGNPGGNLLGLLEARLDNAVFRLGLAPTIPAARQLVSHGHVTVNGATVDRPGKLVRRGEVVALAPRARTRAALVEAAGAPMRLRTPEWLEPLADGFGGTVVGQPDRSAVPFPVDEALVVEFYAR